MARRSKTKTAMDRLADAEKVDTPTRGGKGHNSKTPPAEFDEATLQHHIDQIQGAHLRLEEKLRETASVRGEFAAIKKAAKKAGAPVAAIMEALGLKKQEAGEVVSHYRNVGRVLKMLNAPLGTQWNLFADVETVDVMDADAAGYHAGKNGEPASNNPHQAGTEEHARWTGGWNRWVAENAPGARKYKNGGDPAKAKVEAEYSAEGARAYHDGVEISDNPYDGDAKAHALWREGWVGEQNAKGAGAVQTAEGVAGHA
ncbi:MAG: hypothetical protein KF889_25490 [Alphaproteobacteria bacterium]|nr:hypothetical protein [Alphaproteobacteria bacterium]MCW5739651.1 hypothetical protein [Alphaproteobacteria bacterium]